MAKRILGVDYGHDRTFTLDISDFVRNGSSGIEYGIKLQTTRNSNGHYWMDDDSEIPFSGDRSNLGFNLGVQTEKKFAEVMQFFQKIGFPLTSKVFMLSYDGNLVMEAKDNFLGALERKAKAEEGIPHVGKSIYHEGGEDEIINYHKLPALFGHLFNPDFLSDVDRAKSINLRLYNDGAGVWRGVNLGYTQNRTQDFFRGEILRREVAYQDIKLNLMLLSQVLSLSPFQLNSDERDLLENMINDILKTKGYRPEQLDLFEREPGTPFTGNLPNS